MAHKGRLWPVAFRRDWNLNLTTNTLGWANRYVGHVSSVHFSGQGGVISGFEFDAGPSDDSTFPSLLWQSSYQHIGTSLWRVELLAQIVGGQTFFRQVGFEVKNFGIVLVINLPGSTTEHFPGNFSADAASAAFWSPEWYDFDPSPISVRFRPKDWQDGQPH